MTDSLLLTIRAVLDALAPQAASGDRDEAFALAALQAIGDALRGRVRAPPEFRRWLLTCRDDALASALQPLLRECETWALPLGGYDPMLSFLLRRRDEAESVRAALDWRAVVCAAGQELTAARAALHDALRHFDDALATLATRDEVDALLGDRVALDDRGWRSLLRDEERSGSVREAPEVLAEPSASVLDAWLCEGQMFRYVQRYATQDPEFARRLCMLVDAALVDARDDRSFSVGFVAQRWRQMQDGGRERTTVRVHVVPERRLAAATDAEPLPRRRVRLGQLAPLNASASIECDGAGATLKIFADDELSQVTWGGVPCDPPPQGTPWTATTPLSSAPVSLAIVTAGGARLEFDVDLQTASTP